MRTNKHGWNNFDISQDIEDFEDLNEDDTITVFDLVHRGRQLNQIKKNNAMKKGKVEIEAPRIMSPMTSGLDSRQRSLNGSKATFFPASSSHQGSSVNLLGKKNLTLSYKQGMTKEEKKNAIKHFHKEIQSAILPEIKSAVREFGRPERRHKSND